MTSEYLLFDLFVGLPPLLLGLWTRSGFRQHIRPALWACTLVAIPFLVWDALVSGHHWWFDSRYILGLEVVGLPLEEIAFFFAVPFACVFTWETVLRGHTSRPHRDYAVVSAVVVGLVPLAIVMLALGKTYTGLSLFACAGAAALDRLLGTRLLAQPRFFGFLALVAVLNLVFNGFLTARPIVHYATAVRLGLRIFSVPIEDFAYGTALVGAVTVAYQHRLGRSFGPSWVARMIARRLGGYRQRFVVPDPTKPLRVASPAPRVAIVGGGLAGISAATTLAERGFSVTLFDRQRYLGGKIGAWVEDDHTPIEHGFHAYFPHYYNLRAFLREIGVEPSLRPIGSYVILAADGRRHRFDGERRAPGLNLLALARQGLFSVPAVAAGPAGRQLRCFLAYEAAATASQDHTSFAEFAERAALPRDLRTVSPRSRGRFSPMTIGYRSPSSSRDSTSISSRTTSASPTTTSTARMRTPCWRR